MQAALGREAERASKDASRAAEHGFDDLDEEFFRQEDRFTAHATAAPHVDSFDDLNDGVAPPKSFWKRLFSTGDKPAPAPAAPPRPARPPSTPHAATAGPPRKPATNPGPGTHKGKHGKKRR
jgi:hypothetical protein